LIKVVDFQRQFQAMNIITEMKVILFESFVTVNVLNVDLFYPDYQTPHQLVLFEDDSCIQVDAGHVPQN